MCTSVPNAIEERELLPTNVTPVHYDLLLAPDLDALTYTGQVSIKVRINESTDKIVLHSNELEIEGAVLSSTDLQPAESLTASSITLVKDDETAHLAFAQPLPSGIDATLKIKFRGILNDLMVGFYRSKYTDAEGNTRNMATTQFEPTDARRAFPCWDEPMQKATFNVTLRVKEELTALSNMDVATTESVGGGLKEVSFNTTPIMSTYLLAFIVGELDYIESETSGKHNGRPIPCRVYTAPGKSEKGRFALNVAVQVLEYFADVFGIAYPLPKLDQVAISDFEAGAMENWGLITYREVALLVDEATTSSRAKQQVAYVVSHELAHQWFGNLVTMEWWSELWLNEGFATWVGTLAVDHVFPEYHIWTQFLVDDLQRALALDSLRSSHPIQVPVRRSSEISQIFDAISYSKGGSAIRMLSSYIGLDSFFKGVRAYLQKHKYANASTENLWNALSEASGVDVTKFMALWTQTIGYPLLTVTEEEGGAAIRVRQNRYLSAGGVTDAEDQTLWWVPLGIDTSDSRGQRTSDVLTEREATVAVPVAASKWYKLNRDTVGIYRVKYPASAVANLATAIANGELSVNDRIGVIADAASLASSGDSSTSDFLTFLKAYSNETEFVVWQEIVLRLDTLQSVWASEDEEVHEKFRALSRTLFSPLVKHLGWDAAGPNEDSLVSRLRALAIRAAGFAGDEEVISETQRRFSEFFNGNKSVFTTDTLRVAFSVAVRKGGRDEFDKVKGYYLDPANPVDQQLAALSSLGFTTDPALIEELLEFALTDEVRNQDLHQAIVAINTNGANRERLWKWYQDNYTLLVGRYRASMNYMGILVRLATSEFIGSDKADEVERYFAERDTSKFQRVIDQSLEKIRSNTAWFAKDQEDVRAWLASNSF
ncbi:aminopeptidase [Martensiomyces pterosporus]|nr:aminopeptidase [Martensiomyces pterosporus]